MNKLELGSEFRVVNPDEKSYLQQFVFDGEDSEEKGVRFIVLIRINKTVFGAEEVAEAVAETLRKALVSKGDNLEIVDPFVKFENAVKEVNQLFEEFKKEDNFEPAGLSIVVAAFIGSELLVCQRGEAEVYLVRRQHVTTICEATSNNKKGELFENIAMGNVEKGDVVVFSTERLLRYIVKSEMPEFFQFGAFEDQANNFYNHIKTEALGEIGILTILVNEMGEVMEGESNYGMDDRIVEKFQKSSSGIISKIGDFFEKLNFIPKTSLGSRVSRDDESVNSNNYSFDKFEKLKEILGNWISIAIKPEYRAYAIFGLLGVALVLVLGFKLLLYFGGLNDYKALVTDARTQIEEAKRSTDKVTAASILSKAEVEMQQLLSVSLIRKEAQNVLDEINQVRGQFDQVVVIDEPILIGDLNELSEYTEMRRLLSFYDDVIVANDYEIATVLVDSIKTPIEINSGKMIKLVSAMQDAGVIYALTEGNKLFQIANDEVSSVEIDEDQDIKPAADIESFGTRLYVLDNENKQIWKYQKTTTGLGGPESYLKTATLPESKDMAIDGSVYVLTNNNQLIRYFSGQIDNFKITNQPLLLPQNPSRIYTTEDEGLLYLLEPSRSKIFVYLKNQQTKDLDYLKQYQVPSLSQIVDFAVQSESKRIYITDGESVYSIEI